ncbi:NAD-dependent malic enzyme [Listeria valentina]|uniref:NAD-dependent malic enzyme n=1 Tax=Listeria valentina TaxID=2705293 RepID=UPI001431E4DA|nr:NAD-dependent malic enzyme [Listeria valentina]
MLDLKGKARLEDPFLNKGLAFTEQERESYGLHGLLPDKTRTLLEQVELEYQKLGELTDHYAKNKYLMTLYHTNRVLFYRLISEHIEELLPVIYTPTIADSVMHYSKDFAEMTEAVFLDSEHPERIRDALLEASRSLEQVDLLVITDGEGVLGIGDWGVGGVMIAVGKLAVYTVASGIDPKRVLPVVIDNGTSRSELLNDPHYVGKKKPRLTGETYLQFIDRLAIEAEKAFPGVLFHWEDFGRENASVILERYRNRLTTFNDDIQGTGVMMAAAAHAVSKVTQKSLTEHRFLIFGAGTAGVGVAEQIKLELVRAGLSEEAARNQFYLIDRNGLITEDMLDLTDGQSRLARKEVELRGLTELPEIIQHVMPTVLIGTSGQPGAFTQEAVTAMCAYQARPAIMPISNPTHLAEAKAEDLIRWSDGKALVVTGSPSKPVPYQGVSYEIGQANNALLYPGLGLGIVISKAKRVTDGMLSSAANSLGELQDLKRQGASLLPPVKEVRKVSLAVTEAVVQAAIHDQVNTKDIPDVKKAVAEDIWQAEYEN